MVFKIMFNVDQAISEWRKRMAAQGIKSHEILDELESHLRADVQERIRSGRDVSEAFQAAVQRIGQAPALKAEFAKTGRTRGALEKLMIAICIVFVAFILFLSSAAIILCFTALADRIAAGTAVICILLAAFGWPYVVPFLPAIAHKRKRIAVALGCILAGIGVATLFTQVILPHFGVPYEHQIPSVGFWIIVPMAIGLGLGCGIDQAGRSRGTRVIA
jgi:hypothetical protein